jgi:hypothetical protein
LDIVYYRWTDRNFRLAADVKKLTTETPVQHFVIFHFKFVFQAINMLEALKAKHMLESENNDQGGKLEHMELLGRNVCATYFFLFLRIEKENQVDAG